MFEKLKTPAFLRAAREGLPEERPVALFKVFFAFLLVFMIAGMLQSFALTPVTLVLLFTDKEYLASFSTMTELPDEGALLDTVEQLKDVTLDVDLYVLGSTQEETHSTGAITAAYGIVPDFCVAVDVTHGDSPDAPKEKTFTLGGGPVLGIGPNCTPWMVRRMRRKAEELGMECQTEVMSGHSGTNGWPLQVSREGIATAVLSLPQRYMHTPVETVCRNDMIDLARLLAEFIRNIGEEAPDYDA